MDLGRAASDHTDSAPFASHSQPVRRLSVPATHTAEAVPPRHDLEHTSKSCSDATLRPTRAAILFGVPTARGARVRLACSLWNWECVELCDLVQVVGVVDGGSGGGDDSSPCCLEVLLGRLLPGGRAHGVYVPLLCGGIIGCGLLFVCVACCWTWVAGTVVLYKFQFDDEWVLNPISAVCRDADGRANNCLCVGEAAAVTFTWNGQARNVAVAGTFSGWKKVAMRSTVPGPYPVWETRLSLPPGTSRCCLGPSE